MMDTTEYILRLVESTNLLTDYPKLGKIYFYNDGYTIRKLIHEKHIILYYINNDIIHIIAVIHHKQESKRRIDYIKNFFNKM